MKALLPIVLLFVCMCFEIVPSVEVKAEPVANGNGTNEFIKEVPIPTEAGAPKGYWNLRSWVRFASEVISVLTLHWQLWIVNM